MTNELTMNKGFIMVNKTLAKLVGLIPTTIYGELLSTFNYWAGRNKLTMIDGKAWFFCTIEDLEDKTTIKKGAQAQAIKLLEQEGFIETKRYGLPAKRYFHITNKFDELFVSDAEPVENTDVHSDEACSNQIATIEQSTMPTSEQQHVSISDTNNKQTNNKQNTLSNELAIANYQGTAQNMSPSIPKNIQQPVIDVDDIAQQVEQQRKANEPITNEHEAIRLLTNTANEYYNEFKIGRWNKKQWTTLISKFVSETIMHKRYLNVTYGKLKGYVFAALNNMAKHHDYKYSEEFKQYKETMKEMYRDFEGVSLAPGEYNWLEDRS